MVNNIKYYFLLLFCIVYSFGYEYQLTFGPGDDGAPDWSPDGSKICFASNRSGNMEIYVIPSTGGTAINISNNPAEDNTPCWSPDGTQIAYTSNRSGNYDIWAMNSEGTNQHQLTFLATQDWTPSWSPDGSKIAYSSEGTGGSSTNWLCVIPATGGSMLQLVNGSDNNYCPTWSPDSIMIGYMFDPFWLLATIFTIPAVGGTPTPITDAQSNCYNPDWSNDGLYFAFYSVISPGTTYDVWKVNANGTNYQRITSKPGEESGPSWSPDGTKIAYTYDDGSGDKRIWVTDLSQVKVAPASLGQIKANYAK